MDITTPLPRTESGHIDTSARFGEVVLVRVTYNTDPTGAPVDETDDSNFTLHGPFRDTDEAVEWMNDHAPDDTDIREVETIVANAVR